MGGDAVPDTYDWSFMAHGGSADLAFGDGDWAEGGSLFGLSCLPDSQTVSMTWQGAGEAVLTSGTATGTFREGSDSPVDHPVFSALRETGSLALGMDDTDLTLTAKAAGRAQIRAFFDYCTHPLPPPVPEPAAAIATEPGPMASEGDDQTDNLAGMQPVEPGVDVVQPDGAAQQPVDR